MIPKVANLRHSVTLRPQCLVKLALGAFFITDIFKLRHYPRCSCILFCSEFALSYKTQLRVGGGLCSRSLLWSVNTEQAGVWWLPSWRGERDGSSSTSNSPARSRSSLGCTKRQWRGIRKSATR